MKLQIILNQPNEIRSGYLLVDPWATGVDDPYNRIKCDPVNLDPVCDNNELEELLVMDVLDFYPRSLSNQILDHWLSKIRHDGILSLSVLDYRSIFRASLSEQLNEETVNALLYGGVQPWEIKRTAYTLQQIVTTLASKGMKILKKETANFKAVVVAKRP